MGQVLALGVSMRLIAGSLFWASIAAFGYALWHLNDFPSTPFTETLNAPQQEALVSPSERTVHIEEESYLVKGLYDYKLDGLVVSMRHHDGDRGLHKQWKDHINVADLCVLWGDSAQSPHLNAINFWSGRFTCFMDTQSEIAFNSILGHELSNNHLLSNDPRMRERIQRADIGDHVRIRGYLANYRNLTTHGFRGTSTNRFDTGDGACETIWVTDFQVVGHHKSGYRYLALGAALTLLVSIYLFFRAPKPGSQLTDRERNLLDRARKKTAKAPAAQ